jgi:hypothetical protein
MIVYIQSSEKLRVNQAPALSTLAQLTEYHDFFNHVTISSQDHNSSLMITSIFTSLFVHSSFRYQLKFTIIDGERESNHIQFRVQSLFRVFTANPVFLLLSA